jgi:mannitol/fructose-specific phosphotransferase system IIA component (Ntr-type)
MIDSKQIVLPIPNVGDMPTHAVFVPHDGIKTLEADPRLPDVWRATWRKIAEQLRKYVTGEEKRYNPKMYDDPDRLCRAEHYAQFDRWEELSEHEWYLILLHAVELMSGGRPDVTDSYYHHLLRHEFVMGPCGMGRGWSVPHFKSPSVTEQQLAVVVSEQGYDYSALDGEPVYAAFVESCHIERPGEHLCMLERAGSWMRDETFRRFLYQSRSADDICQLLQEMAEFHST